MQTRALIFDMDGTMVDSLGYHARSWAVFAQRHGLTVDLVRWMPTANGRTSLECMHELFDRTLSEAEARDLVAEKGQIYRELFEPAFTEIAGFRAFAEHASAKGLKIAVGTAGDRHNIAFTLRHLGLKTAPEALVGGDEGLAGKPDPAIFLEAARRMQVSPDQCIVFEDAALGIEAAGRAGMRAVAIGRHHAEPTMDAAHVIARASQYLELMDTKFLETLDVAYP